MSMTLEQRRALGRKGGTAKRRLRPVLERFMEKVSPEPNTGCWLWMGGTASNGCYGQFYFSGSNRPAHRLAYELFKSPIAPGLDALHKCDNPLCCCPDHIFLGDARANAKDMVRKGRHKRPLSSYEATGACPHGHPATSESVAIRKNSRGNIFRMCRVCERERWRRRSAA